MLNVLGMARIGTRDETSGYTPVEVDPSDLYPQTIAHLRELLDAERAPDSSALRTIYDEARELEPWAWDVALGDADGSPLTPYGVEQRRAALELARRWFTEVLHQAIGGPIHLRITRDEQFRL